MNSTDVPFDDDCDFRYSTEEATPQLHNIYHKIMFLGFVPLIVTFGLFWNLAMLFVVYRVKSMRNTTNVYLSNLAVSDAALLVTSGIQYLTTYSNASIDLASDFSFATPLGCLAFEMAAELFYFASVFLVWLVTFERYLAVCHPMRHLKIKGKRWTVSMTIGVWIASLSIAVLAYPYHEVQQICVRWPDESKFRTLQSKFPLCSLASYVYENEKMRVNLEFWPRLFDVCQFTLAVSMCTYMFIRMIYTLSTRCNPNAAETLAVRNQIARMLILNGTVFFLCLVPFRMININSLSLLVTNKDIFSNLRIIYIIWLARVTTLVNSAINPILYNVSNATYRAAFAEAFGRKKKKTSAGSRQRTAKTPMSTRLSDHDQGIRQVVPKCPA
ncbi:somatostatin receptor type 5-like [Amphiura filiformis]|uniref:somatostatin receptor type 5-like n=1 Tax=Amphiura filiformis TaxID=82378 RepID=UPI003B222CE4